MIIDAASKEDTGSVYNALWHTHKSNTQVQQEDFCLRTAVHGFCQRNAQTHCKHDPHLCCHLLVQLLARKPNNRYICMCVYHKPIHLSKVLQTVIFLRDIFIMRLYIFIPTGHTFCVFLSGHRIPSCQN